MEGGGAYEREKKEERKGDLRDGRGLDRAGRDRIVQGGIGSCREE